MADWHNEELGGKTLLQAASTPYMDLLARNGRTGMLKTIQDGFHPGSEVANSSILGYDQKKVYEGRGPLEAASIGVELAPDDMAIRCNLICIEDEKIKNHSCGHLDTEEGKCLWNTCKSILAMTEFISIRVCSIATSLSLKVETNTYNALRLTMFRDKRGVHCLSRPAKILIPITRQHN